MTDKKGINNLDVRKENQKKIWSCFLTSEEISNRDIAETLGLTFPTINQSIQYFLEMGLLVEMGKQKSSGGRKPKLYRANLDIYFSVGVDITRNHVNISVIDLAGNVKYNCRIQKQYENSMNHEDSYARFLSDLVNSTIQEQCPIGCVILGVGISVPGIVNEEGTILLQSHVLDEKNVSISHYNAFLSYPSFLINDANAGGYSELKVHSQFENCVFFSLSNSVGGSIYINGKTIFGNHMQSGEIGHMCIHPNGKECYCGKKGCLDSYCAAHLLSDLTDGNLEQFFIQLKDNSEFQSIWDTYLNNLAIAINNIKMILDVDIIVGGYVGSYLEDYLPILKRKVKEISTFETEGEFIFPTMHKVGAASIGAAYYYVDAFVENL